MVHNQGGSGGPPQLSMSLVPQEAPQPANSVLGTLVNEDAVSDLGNDNDNDVKSLQPSLSQGSPGRPHAAALAEPSHHDSILQTASATSAPPPLTALNTLLDYPVLNLLPEQCNHDDDVL